MTRFAVPLHDLDVVWRTPAGAALVDAALANDRVDDAEVVDVHGAEALVLRGTGACIEALAAGFAAAAFPAPAARTVRVFADDGAGWRRMRASDVAHGDEVAAGEGGGRTCRGERPGPGRASRTRACRFQTSAERD
jgi:hypothetical protein